MLNLSSAIIEVVLGKKGKSNKQSGSRSIAGAMGYGVFLIFALLVGSLGGWVSQSKIMGNVLKQVLRPTPPEVTFKGDTITLLILGCDEDIDEHTKKVTKHQARSDMMLVCKLDFKNKMVTGVSIPRDTRCEMPGYKPVKINAFHAIAKKGHEAELTQQAVEFLLPGIKIDKVVTLDFDHFQDLVNIVGGVPMTVEKNLNWDDYAAKLHIHIKKGYQLMDGVTAMGFVRYRHADSDFMRQKRQKQFMLAFKQQAMKDWTKLPQIVNEGEKVLGGALSSDEIASLALFARSVPPQNIQWGQVPVTDGPGNDLTLDEDKLPSVLAQYRLTDLAPSASNKHSNN